jgi:amidophosphoribosyltransferase
VYFASAAPPVRYPNVYGIDMPTRSELIANGRSDGEIAQMIGADMLIYQDLESLKQAVRDTNPTIGEFEASCFDGCYVTGDVSKEYLADIENRRETSGRAEDDEGSQLDLNLVSLDEAA